MDLFSAPPVEPPVDPPAGPFGAWGDRAAAIEAKAYGPDVAGFVRDHKEMPEYQRDQLGRMVAEHLWAVKGLGKDGAFSSEISFVKHGMVTDGMRVGGYIKDADGNAVGQWSRQLTVGSTGELHVHHGFLELSPGVQGLGIARDFNRNAEDGYIAAGVGSITLVANISVGGYAWAAAGYDWKQPGPLDGPGRIADTLRPVRQLAEKMREGGYLDGEYEQRPEWLDMERRLTAAAESGDFSQAPTPFEIASYGRTEGAETWPGKEFMLGKEWWGEKHLSPPD